MTSLLASTAELATTAADLVRERINAGDDAQVVLTRQVIPPDAPGAAVVTAVRGARSGELTVVVYETPGVSTGGEPIRAFTQRLAEVAAEAVGVRADPAAQAIEPRLAINALAADPTTSIAVVSGRAGTLAVIGLKLSEPTPTGGSSPAPRVDPQRLHLLRGVEMAVTAEIGRTRMTVGELLNLAEGSVIELDRPAGSPADLLVNGRLIARGEVVVIDENFALRITDIVSADEER
jgi:flagellar motor switch protein FliN/FliY